MRRRDLLLIIISLIIIIVSLFNQSDYSFELVSEIPINTNNYENSHYPQHFEILPQPLISDVNADGVNELIYVTNDHKLRIQSYSGDNNYLNREVSLLSKTGVSTGRRPVALKTGFITAYSESRSRKQIVVVVTSDWEILCFNDDLQLLWESIAIEDMPDDHFLSEIAISISPLSNTNSSRGIVVVAGRIRPVDYLTHKSKTVVSVDLKDNPNIDYLEDGDLDTEENDHHHNEAEEAKYSDFNHFERDESHFSFFAFNASNGYKLWSHEEGDYMSESQHEKETHSKHSMKQHVFNQLEHIGEVNWMVYKDNILESLPHRWSSNFDTKLDLKHFEKKVSKSIGIDKKSAQQWNSEMIGIYSSNLDSLLNYFTRDQWEDSVHVKDPNVVVAHFSNGLEVVHLNSGRTLCKLVLDSNHLNQMYNDHFIIYLDTNNDGILDQVHSITNFDSQQKQQERKSDFLCTGLSILGYPPKEYLFKRNICKKEYSSRGLFSLSDFTSEQWSHIGLHKGPFTTSPTFIANPETGELEIIFFINFNGIVTSVSPKGTENWRTDTGITWSKETLPYSYPSIQPFSLKSIGKKSNLLVVGESSFSVLDNFGEVLVKEMKVNENELKKKPTDYYNPILAPPVIGDLNNDGYNDIIITTLSSLRIYQSKNNYFSNSNQNLNRSYDGADINQNQNYFILIFITFIILISIILYLIFIQGNSVKLLNNQNRRLNTYLTPIKLKK